MLATESVSLHKQLATSLYFLITYATPSSSEQINIHQRTKPKILHDSDYSTCITFRVSPEFGVFSSTSHYTPVYYTDVLYVSCVCGSVLVFRLSQSSNRE